MAKKLTPTKRVIERQKEEERKKKESGSKEVDIDKLDWTPKKPKVQELEVHPGTGKLEMNQIDAWIEGTNIQIGNIIDQINSLNTLCLENFKNINKIQKQTIDYLGKMLDVLSKNKDQIKEEKTKTKPKNKTDNYIQTIMEETGLSREDIDKQTKEKIEDLKGLISYEGALFIVGNELGIDLEDNIEDIDYKISDIDSHFKGNIAAIVSRMDNVFTFIKKDGEDGRGQKIYITDGSGEIPLTLWNDQVNKIEDIDVGDQILIYKAYGKDDPKYGLSLQLFKDAKIVKKS